MSVIIKGRGLRKAYGPKAALNGVDIELHQGRIVGLIGPNGAGKTTLMRALLGLTEVDGELDVLGFKPAKQRDAMMEHVAYIPDVAVLPRWLRVDQVVAYVAGVHARFSLDRCQELLAKTQIPVRAKIGTLSKGMIAQLHLALVLAIDAELLVLDEPTLGLDILYRKAFYDYLLADYSERPRTILISTHQVEEVEHLLSDVIFINNGELSLVSSLDEIADRFTEVMVAREQAEAARALKPINERDVFGKKIMMFENIAREQLSALGEPRTPGLADVFVAKVSEVRA